MKTNDNQQTNNNGRGAGVRRHRVENDNIPNPRGYGGTSQEQGSVDARTRKSTPPVFISKFLDPSLTNRQDDKETKEDVSDKKISTFHDNDLSNCQVEVSPHEATSLLMDAEVGYPILPKFDEDYWRGLLPVGFEPRRDALMLKNAPGVFARRTIDAHLANDLADRLVSYFARPLDGTCVECEELPDGSMKRSVKKYSVPLPMIAEFASLCGFTEVELKNAAQNFPDSLGRALEFAQDCTKTTLVRKGLTREIDSGFATFVLTNETRMRQKTEVTNKNVNVSDLLDRIERSTKQAG